METSPSVNSSIRSAMIAIGAVGVSKGWWDQAGLEGLVDQLIVFGGAALAIFGFVWGIRAKRAASAEAKVIAIEVLKKDDEEAEGR